MKNKLEEQRKYRREYPWLSHLYSARQRCNDKNHISYKRYGGKGIKCFLTPYFIYYLWERDKAYKLKKPSLDRRNSKKDYTIDNCKFIELSENSIKESRKACACFKNGKKVKSFKSLSEAGRCYKTSMGNIWTCCNNKNRTLRGLKWKYV